MPNYVLNTVKMAGITTLPLFKTVNGEQHLDFEKLIPTPEELDLESGTLTMDSTLYFLTNRCNLPLRELGKKETALLNTLVGADWLEKMYHRVASQMATASESEKARLYDAGEQYFRNYEKYGVPTWYEWHIRRWGTKWNAMDTHISDCDTVSFYTARRPPVPFLRKLSRTYPEASIYHFCEDECYPFYAEHRWLCAGKELIKPCLPQLEDWCDECQNECESHDAERTIV